MDQAGTDGKYGETKRCASAPHICQHGEQSAPLPPLLFFLTVSRKEMLRLKVGSPTRVDNRQNNMSSEIKLVNFVYTAISLYAHQDPNPNKLSPGLCQVSFVHSACVSAEGCWLRHTPVQGLDQLLISQQGSEEGTINTDTKGGPLVRWVDCI